MCMVTRILYVPVRPCPLTSDWLYNPAMNDVVEKPRKVVQGEKLRGADKMARIPVKIAPLPREQLLRKPKWIRASFTGTPAVAELKRTLRSKGLHTVLSLIHI